ncbi:hypothetical protein [Vibrio phage vB_VmeM-Yong XC32]|nr:hypothetical protein [Vibrio phage vB_VmeM-Yong XC31]QAX96312.1 hypothetical protein [Vibrio phage vB_VmeM-Yong XC32]QAX96630.1 hypothetical protein [Vibrio phage vB_VmeM-Yong MS31]QAX96948.1 hypothetical protein [Vibrio phage vB_VmeM-Yong MS32]
MLYPLPKGSTYRIVATDPGSNTAGFVCVEVDVDKRTYHVIEAITVKGNNVLKRFGELKELNEERFMRNLGYGMDYENFLVKHDPFSIASEAPYKGRFVAAFKALTEQITVLRAFLWKWDRTKTFHLYEPSVVKKAMGVKGGSKDKEDMRRALAKRTDISYGDGISLDVLDEHTVDAVCVAIHHSEKLNLWPQT